LGTLRGACNDLDNAYKMFFGKNNKYPQFKSRKTAKNIFFIRPDRFYVLDNCIHIESIGMIKYKYDGCLPNGIYAIKAFDTRVSVDTFGKWFVTFKMECESQARNTNDFSMGIDLGIKELAVVSCNNQEHVFHNINKSKKMRNIESKIKHVQRSMSRKYRQNKERTNNWERERQKLRRLYAKQTNIRDNYLHQTTRFLVNLLPNRVVMEKLNIIGMMKNKHLAKEIAEQKWYEFTRQMQYKCEWAGIEFVQVDRYYPSSKTCSHCGYIKKDLKLSDRIYKCPVCGLEIDRDLNAAINLEKYIA
jgi:putative transposase